MDLQKRTLQVGAAAILCALLLRLAPVAFSAAGHLLQWEPAVSLLLYLETGQIFRGPPATEPEEVTLPEETPPVTTAPAALPAFSAEDLELVSLSNYAGYSPELGELLCKPLSWELTGTSPTVLIVHTHSTESYTPTPQEAYAQTSPYRTLEEAYNMLSIGDHVAAVLESAGIGVVHARDLHDYPSYSGSYVNSRKTVQAYLKQYPSILLVLDLHRDAIEDSKGNQLGTTVTVNGRKAAQLMMVVGTDAGDRNHPNWQENLALALKLHVTLEKQTPGLCRKISFRTQRFNQDLSPGAMLIEVGAAGNTRQEALAAAQLLAQGIIALAHGSQ